MSEWEVDALRRKRTSEFVKKSVHTLASLSKIVHDMPNVNVLQPVANHAASSASSIQKVRIIC